MSLYGGIFYEEREPAKVESKEKEKDTKEKEGASQPPASQPEPSQKPKQNWTASLKFAPVARRNKAASKPPIPSAFTNAMVSSSTASSSSNTPNKNQSENREQNSSSSNINEINLQAAQSTQLKPPPMTISDNEDDDTAYISGNYRRVLTKKEKKMKRKGQLPAAGPNWNDDYDPYKPTDYMEYKRFAEFLKEERMARKADELSKRQYSSSEYSDSDEEDERSGDRNKFKMFAPPTTYDNDEPTAIDKDETGDEVFQRRLAMSSATAQQARMHEESDVDVAEKGSVVSQPEPQPQPEPEVEPESKQPPQPQQSQPQPQPQPAQFEIVQPPKQPSQTPEDRLKASQAAAASIAAKFNKLVPQKMQLPQQLSPQPPQEVSEVDEFLSTIGESTVSKEQQERVDNKANFAQRFMAKQGWKQGEGLGANKTGMKEALSLERTESGGGEIKSKEEGRLDREAREMFGEPSKTILLRNMVRLDEIDDDLSQEVADECNKHGIVERVVVHTPKEYGDDCDAVKILVKFSGIVGAYKNVRALNDRYFGGTQIIARYYSDDAFNRGIYDL